MKRGTKVSQKIKYPNDMWHGAAQCMLSKRGSKFAPPFFFTTVLFR